MLFIKLIFGFLCGCLYVLGLCLGWDYQEASVYVCLRWWPAICFASTLPIIVGLFIRIIRNKRRWLSLYLLPIVGAYSMLYWRIIQSVNAHYPTTATIASNFNKCLNDLMNIASTCHTTYENVNIIIYIWLFLLIMLTNGLLSYIALHVKTH